MGNTKPSTISVAKRLVFYTVLVFLVSLFSLAVLEIFLRLPRKSMFGVDTSNLLVRSDIPGLGYRLARSYSTGPFQTDEFGFRRRPSSPTPVLRSILLLGDSVAFGGGLPYEENFALLVEKQLSQTLGQQVAVMNSGTPGYNTVQESILFKDLQKSVKPNLVVLQFCMNDFADPVVLTSTSTLDASSSAGEEFSFFPLMYKSRAILFLKEQVKDMEKLYPERFPLALHYIHYVDKHSGWQRAKAAIAEIAGTAKQIDARFLLVIFPVEQQLRIEDHGASDDLVAFAKSRGIEVLDLYPALAGHWREHLYFDYSIEQHVVDKIHLSRRGHELAAQAITAAILNEPILRSALQ